MRLFGQTFDLRLAVLFVVIGLVMGATVLCSCSRVSMAEGFQMLGAPMEHKMGEGVHGAWDVREMPKGSSYAWSDKDHDTYQSQFVSPEEGLDFFAETEFKPECCGSSYSSSGGLTKLGVTAGGCACMNKQQMDYLNSRGGNRAPVM